ncbi:MAG: ankyrin repeat domain-containing protein [Gammaproteobacteria bacterium]|nr:ankyrin repeat domain-containing protein [Gammaproteobacteria bacterium]
MSNSIRELIDTGDVTGLGVALGACPALSNADIVWGDAGRLATDPLHYVSDSVFARVLGGEHASALVNTLLAHGALVDGSPGRETPLIGATSSGVSEVALALIEAGADVSPVALFGATALHWAAYMGMPEVVTKLIEAGGSIELKCSEFAATPLFWAVQGFSRFGPQIKRDQVGAARVLIEAGANGKTRNVEGASLLERARQSESNEMVSLLERLLSGSTQ